MCRLAAYKGPEIFVSSLLTEPKHSIIHQSYHAKEREEPLNGDGFGIGWFAPKFCDDPAIFKEVSPAWNNQNLKDISRVTKSSCIFAHVRAATVGGHISRTNCHPFSWGKYAFMHNGTVFEFEKIKRSLRASLSDKAYQVVNGSTDSEHIFALFVDQICEFNEPSIDDVAFSLQSSIAKIEFLKQKFGVETPSTMNLVVSDGHNLVATKYASRGGEPDSLYFSQGDNFTCEDGVCKMDSGDKAFIIASEPLDHSGNWKKVEGNNMVLVNSDGLVKQLKIEV